MFLRVSMPFPSIRTYNSRCVKLLVDRNHQTPDDAYWDE
uniref:Uncharacterized protein n=1 Tax=Heterorhabditis bacteriophora TaxID=37862 RepID=A0A1I7X8K1_HETBA